MRGIKIHTMTSVFGLALAAVAPVAAQAQDTATQSGVRTESEIVVTAQRKAKEVGLDPEEIRLPVQPPLQRLEGSACVVFSLG